MAGSPRPGRTTTTSTRPTSSGRRSLLKRCWLVDLHERYLAFRAARGDDNAAGLRLAERLARAGLELVEFRGRYVIRAVSPRLRSHTRRSAGMRPVRRSDVSILNAPKRCCASLVYPTSHPAAPIDEQPGVVGALQQAEPHPPATCSVSLSW
jgi:hypothetical protein